MYGFSYVGATQWLAATQAPPHLTTIVPAHTSSDYYDGWFYEGGALSLAFAESWPLSGLVNSAIWRLGEQKAIDEVNKGKDQMQQFMPTCRSVVPASCPTTRRRQLLSIGSSTIPGRVLETVEHPRPLGPHRSALNIGGWYAVFLPARSRIAGMRPRGSEIARSGQRLVIRPYDHMPWVTKVGDVELVRPRQQETTDGPGY